MHLAKYLHHIYVVHQSIYRTDNARRIRTYGARAQVTLRATPTIRTDRTERMAVTFNTGQVYKKNLNWFVFYGVCFISATGILSQLAPTLLMLSLYNVNDSPHQMLVIICGYIIWLILQHRLRYLVVAPRLAVPMVSGRDSSSYHL